LHCSSWVCFRQTSCTSVISGNTSGIGVCLSKQSSIILSSVDLVSTLFCWSITSSDTSTAVAGHSATLVRARSMLRTGHSVPDLTTSMARTVTQTKSFTDSAGHSATLVRARPVLRAGHSAPDFS
ncbi:19170_t:CDS:2, partial [Funneliformis geosporum]